MTDFSTHRLAMVAQWLVLCGLVDRIAPPVGAQTTDEGWAFLENDSLRLGVKTSSGAAIGYLSLSGSDRNLVNHWDHGRLIQQSFYGRRDGSLWNGKPWRWNPVQGGDWRGRAARVLELEQTTAMLRSKSMARHWASGEDLEDVLFEQQITLDGPIVHIRFQMTYMGAVAHPAHNQEIPAVFVAPDLKTLVLFDGQQRPATGSESLVEQQTNRDTDRSDLPRVEPWTNGPLHRSQPGWPNESRIIAEHWAAYVDEEDFGLGVYVPISEKLTCYRFGNGDPERGSCSYFAPLTTLSIRPNMVFKYDAYLTIGSVEEIRTRFARLHHEQDP